MGLPIKKLIRNISSRNHILCRKCYVCGDTEVQNHHIIKVEHLATLLDRFKLVSPREIPIPTEDLCDEHHKKAHYLYGDRPRTDIITRSEADKLLEMVNLAEASKILDEGVWADEYNKLVDKTINTVDKNIDRYFEEEHQYDKFSDIEL